MIFHCVDAMRTTASAAVKVGNMSMTRKPQEHRAGTLIERIAAPGGLCFRLVRRVCIFYSTIPRELSGAVLAGRATAQQRHQEDDGRQQQHLGQQQRQQQQRKQDQQKQCSRRRRRG